MPTNLRQLPFRVPHDARRALERLAQASGGDGHDWSKADRGELAALFSFVQPVWAAYDAQEILDAGTIAADYTFMHPFGYPVSLSGEANGLGGELNKDFWRSAVHAENIDNPLTDPFKLDFMSGWYFLVRDITLEFFTSAGNQKAGQVMTLRSANMERTDSSGLWKASDPFTPLRFTLIGQAQLENSVLRQQFATHGPAAFGNINATNQRSPPGWLREFPLLPNAAIFLQEFKSLASTDVIEMTMSGEWRFSPYFMSKGDEPRR